MSQIEIKLQFPYVVQAQYEHRTAANTHQLNTTTCHRDGYKVWQFGWDVWDAPKPSIFTKKRG